MKLLNIFKKDNKKVVTTTAQKLDKKQLEKVIGGVDTTLERKSGSVILTDRMGNEVM